MGSLARVKPTRRVWVVLRMGSRDQLRSTTGVRVNRVALPGALTSSSMGSVLPLLVTPCWFTLLKAWPMSCSTDLPNRLPMFLMMSPMLKEAPG